MNKMIKDANDISPLREMLEVDETLTRESILEQAIELLQMYDSDDTIFYEGLHDDDPNVRSHVKKEKQRLIKFIKKYKK